MSNKKLKVNILGTYYEIIERSGEEDINLVEADGYCDSSNRTIILRKEMGEDMGDHIEVRKRVLRHELTHAMLIESGLDICSGSTDCWARNETMVDWISLQGLKLYEVWKSVDAV